MENIMKCFEKKNIDILKDKKSHSIINENDKIIYNNFTEDNRKSYIHNCSYSITWFKDDKLYKEFSFYENTQLKSETYFFDGEIHKEDGPAHILWNIDGSKYIEIWYKHGKKDRKNEPAFLEYRKNKIILEEYYDNDKLLKTYYNNLDMTIIKKYYKL